MSTSKRADARRRARHKPPPATQWRFPSRRDASPSASRFSLPVPRSVHTCVHMHTLSLYRRSPFKFAFGPLRVPCASLPLRNSPCSPLRLPAAGCVRACARSCARSTLPWLVARCCLLPFRDARNVPRIRTTLPMYRYMSLCVLCLFGFLFLPTQTDKRRDTMMMSMTMTYSPIWPAPRSPRSTPVSFHLRSPGSAACARVRCDGPRLCRVLVSWLAFPCAEYALSFVIPALASHGYVLLRREYADVRSHTCDAVDAFLTSEVTPWFVLCLDLLCSMVLLYFTFRLILDVMVHYSLFRVLEEQLLSDALRTTHTDARDFQHLHVRIPYRSSRRGASRCVSVTACVSSLNIFPDRTDR